MPRSLENPAIENAILRCNLSAPANWNRLRPANVRVSGQVTWPAHYYFKPECQILPGLAESRLLTHRCPDYGFASGHPGGLHWLAIKKVFWVVSEQFNHT